VLRERGAPPVDVPPYLLPDRCSVKSPNGDALVRGDRGEQFVTARPPAPKGHQQRLEVAAGRDPCRQVADLALDGLGGQSLLIDVARGPK